MRTVIFSAALAFSVASLASAAIQQPSSAPVAKISIVQGCYSSVGELELKNGNVEWNSRSECGDKICGKAGNLVAATTEGNKCFCGNKFPPLSKLADDTMCNVSCTGYGDACGGLGYFTLYNTGIQLYNVPHSEDKATSSPTSSPSSAPTAPGGETIVVTQSSDSNASAKPAGPNTAGIAAGVVVGVVALGAIAGGVFFFMRRRRNQAIEEEHRRNAAINSFVGGGKPPSSSGGWSNSDSRLDPVMAQRRMSDGSIADNQDYSRKILRVTNA